MTLRLLCTTPDNIAAQMVGFTTYKNTKKKKSNFSLYMHLHCRIHKIISKEQKRKGADIEAKTVEQSIECRFNSWPTKIFE